MRKTISDYEDRVKAATFKRPEYVPVSAGALPAAWMKHREALDAIVRRHPIVFGRPGEKRDFDAVGGTYVEGDHTDAWGCVWSNVRTGMEAIVTRHPVPTREDVHRLKPPEKDIGFPHGFMYLRLADLRGFEEVMIDFAEEAPELQRLIDVVLEYNMRQAELKLASLRKPKIIYFGDDLGMQTGLAMGPAKWRKYLKPCFKKIYEPFKKAGHLVFMHTDGCIWEIIPDLIECGVDIVNPQFRANGLDNLERVCRGKVCISLDLDRQMFPFCKPADIDAHVHEVVRKLGSHQGGLWLQAEIGPDVPLENVEAIAVAMEKYRGGTWKGKPENTDHGAKTKNKR